MKHYLYLIKTSDKSKFKIGYTSNPKKRYKTYKTHNPDFIFECYYEVPSKKHETMVHNQLKVKHYDKIQILNGWQEWFEGEITNKEFKDLIDEVIK